MNSHLQSKQDSGTSSGPHASLDLLARLSELVSEENNLPEMLSTFVQIVFESLPCTCCRILIPEPGTDFFQVAAAAGDCSQEDPETLRVKRDDIPGILSQGSSKSVIVRADEGRSPQSVTGLPGHPNLGGLSVPLVGKDGVLGLLEAFFGPEQSIGPQPVKIIQVSANLLSAAIDRVQADMDFQELDKELEEAITRRTEWIQLLSETTIAANEADSVAEAMQTVLTKVCLYTRWPVGHVYLPAKDGPPELLPTPVWFTRDPERYQPFIQATQGIRFPIGASLPGKVFETGKPIWVVDISAKGFLRAAEAQMTGLKAAFAFPVLVQKEVVAVMEFFTDQAVPPDQPLLDVVANIGIQVGRVIERRHAQEELEISQQQLAEAHRIARLGTWEWQIATNKLTCSNRLFEIYGLDPAEFNNSYEEFLSRIVQEDRQRVEKDLRIAAAQAGSFEFQYRILRPDGEIRVLQVRGDVITDASNNPIRMVGTGQDITRRTQIEDELRTHEELLRSVITAAPIILWAVDRDGTITLIEGTGLAYLDADLHNFIGKSITDIAGGREKILAYIQRALAGEQVIAELEVEGHIFDTRFAPMLDNNTDIVGVTGVSIDITSRVQAEAARQASDARFRTIFEGSAIGIGIIDLDHRLLVANPVLKHMLGLTGEEIQHKQLETLIYPLDRSRSEAQIESLLSGDAALFHKEIRFLRKGQSPIWTSLSASLVRDPNGSPNFAIVMLEDISSRKQMEAELTEIQQQLVASRENERLHLAQEIHDDPLQNLYGLLYQLDSVLEEVTSEQGQSEVQTMQASINQIINALRGICRGLRPPTLMPFGLEVSIREHVDSFQKEHPELKIYLNLMYDGQSLSEHVRLTLFRIYQQAISNVARHARANKVTVAFRFDDRQALLIVEDDGQGFSVPGRWVEFVRKNHMGLAGSAERVEILHGRFKVISSPGNGTRIEAAVPRSPTNLEEEMLTEAGFIANDPKSLHET